MSERVTRSSDPKTREERAKWVAGACSTNASALLFGVVVAELVNPAIQVPLSLLLLAGFVWFVLLAAGWFALTFVAREETPDDT